MRLFTLLLTFTLFTQAVFAQSNPGGVSVLGDQSPGNSYLGSGRMIQSNQLSRFGGTIKVANDLIPSITGNAFLQGGVYIQPAVINVCDQIQAATQANDPAQMLEQIIRGSRTELTGIPRHKFQDAFNYFKAPRSQFTFNPEYADQYKKTFCQVNLARAVSASILAKANPGVSGVDPKGEKNRQSADLQHIEDQLRRCELGRTNFRTECPPLEFDTLNKNVSNDIFGISKILSASEFAVPPSNSLLNSMPGSLGFLPSRTSLLSMADESYLTPAQKLCRCNEDNFKLADKPIGAFIEDKGKVSGLVRDQLYKKFLNDYAQNREDITFFMNHRGNILKGQNSDALACKKISDFQERANTKCSASGVSAEVRKQRESELFAKLGLDNPDGSLNEHWQQLESTISTIKYPQGTQNLPKNLSSKGFNRISFDEARHGFSQDNRSKAFNKLLTNLAKDSDFRLRQSAFPDIDPSILLIEFLEDIKSKNDPARIDAIAKMAEDDEAIDIATFKQDISENFLNLMQDVTAYAPEFRIVLSNAGLFNEVMKNAAKPDFKDFGAVIQNNPKDGEPDKASLIYENHMKWKCGQIMESFANAVCTDDNKLVENANSDDLRKLIQQNPSLDIDPEYATHLACQNKFNINTIPLDIDVPYSSLLSRLENGKDFFATIKDLVVQEDKTVLSYISGMAREASHSSVQITDRTALDSNNRSLGVSSSGTQSHYGGHDSIWDHVASDGSIKSERVYSGNKLISSPEVQSASREKGSVTETTGSLNETDKTKSDQVAEQIKTKDQNIAADVPFASSYSNRASPERGAQESSKNELRQILGNEGNKPEVQQQVSRIDDDMAQELVRLREEAAQNRQKLQELTSQAQESKIRLLQDQLNALKQERSAIAEALPTQVVNPTNGDNARNEYIITPPRNSNLNREIASEEQNAEVAPIAPVQKNGTTSDPSSSSSAVNGNRSQGNRGDNNSSPDNSSGTTPVPLIVTATTVRSESNVDMNLEIIKFLDSANPDLTTLTQIKDQGLLYRYKVMENGVEREQEVLIKFSRLNDNARQALERKITQRRSENPRLAEINDAVAEVERKHSYESLKYIIGQQISRR